MREIPRRAATAHGFCIHFASSGRSVALAAWYALERGPSPAQSARSGEQLANGASVRRQG